VQIIRRALLVLLGVSSMGLMFGWYALGQSWIEKKPLHATGEQTLPIQMHGAALYVTAADHWLYQNMFLGGMICLLAYFAVFFFWRNGKAPDAKDR
jgi:hypothetical protein